MSLCSKLEPAEQKIHNDWGIYRFSNQFPALQKINLSLVRKFKNTTNKFQILGITTAQHALK